MVLPAAAQDAGDLCYKGALLAYSQLGTYNVLLCYPAHQTASPQPFLVPGITPQVQDNFILFFIELHGVPVSCFSSSLRSFWVAENHVLYQSLLPVLHHLKKTQLAKGALCPIIHNSVKYHCSQSPSLQYSTTGWPSAELFAAGYNPLSLTVQPLFCPLFTYLACKA